MVKHWPMTKVKSILEATLIPAPAARVSRGWISLQQPRPRHIKPCREPPPCFKHVQIHVEAGCCEQDRRHQRLRRWRRGSGSNERKVRGAHVGYSQPMGPQPYACPQMYTQMTCTGAPM